MPDKWKITIQKTGEREQLSAPQTALDGTQDGNKPITIGIVTVTDPQGREHKFDFQSGGYGNGPMPGLDNPNATSKVAIQWGTNILRASGENIGAPYEATNGTDYWLRFEDDPALMGSRFGFGFHPDGGYLADWRTNRKAPPKGQLNDGTAGCIGIKASQAQQFFDILESIPKDQRPTHLTILSSTHGLDLQRKGTTMPLSPKDKTYQIQAFLKLQGYDPNGVDGALGNGMAKAFQKYAVAKQLPQAICARADQLVAETAKKPDQRNQKLINTIRDEIYDYVVRASTDAVLRKDLATKAFEAVQGTFSKENAKAARATALLLDPAAQIKIEAEVGTVIDEATLTVLQAEKDKAITPSQKADYGFGEGNLGDGRTNTDLQQLDKKAKLPTYADVSARIGKEAEGYRTPVHTTGKRSQIAHSLFVTEVMNVAIDKTRNELTSGFNLEAVGRTPHIPTNLSNKGVREAFESATAYRKIKNNAYGQSIKIKTGDLIFEKYGKDKRAIVVTKIDKEKGIVEAMGPNGVFKQYQLNWFTSGDTKALRAAGVRGIGDTSEYLQETGVFPDDALRTDPTILNEELNTPIFDKTKQDLQRTTPADNNSGQKIIRPITGPIGS